MRKIVSTNELIINLLKMFSKWIYEIIFMIKNKR